MNPKWSVAEIRERLKDIILRSGTAYKLFLQCEWGASGHPERPSSAYKNSVLKRRQEWEESTNEIRSLGLFSHIDLPKNWDSLKALECILENTVTTSSILDAGSELYSVILQWLFLYGYKSLTGINLVFNRNLNRGPVRYEYGDIVKTRFSDNAFSAVTCLSVIEHGVDLGAFFRESSRILKRGGTLVVSTDYYPEPIDTSGKEMFGAPLHIFSREEILSVIDMAGQSGLELTMSLDLDAQEKAVYWKDFDLEYTFLIFALRKNC